MCFIGFPPYSTSLKKSHILFPISTSFPQQCRRPASPELQIEKWCSSRFLRAECAGDLNRSKPPRILNSHCGIDFKLYRLEHLMSMVSGKESCPTRRALLAAWQTAAEIYAKAVADLSRQIGVVPKEEYEKLRHLAESARRSSTEARANLQSHMKQHGCDGNGEVAA
jgi:hypothetical protein